jgi:hypothetical protein
MHVRLRFIDPEAMLSAAEAEMGEIASEELFNNPRHQPLLDRWCAGSFAVAYALHLQKCRVAMEPPEAPSDADFHLRIDVGVIPFQTAEVQRPGRRRGEEYRQRPTLTPYRPAADGADGPGWIRGAVQKKADKHYSTARHLNLLVYADFTTEQLEWASVARELVPFRDEFASLWVITYNALGTVFSTPEIGCVGSCDAWGIYRSAPFAPALVMRGKH